MFRQLTTIFAWKLCIAEVVFLWEFKLNFCTCAQSMALGKRTKVKLQILTICVTFGIVFFRAIILESSQNVSKTTPWLHFLVSINHRHGMVCFLHLFLLQHILFLNTQPNKKKITHHQNGHPGSSKELLFNLNHSIFTGSDMFSFVVIMLIVPSGSMWLGHPYFQVCNYTRQCGNTWAYHPVPHCYKNTKPAKRAHTPCEVYSSPELDFSSW